MGGRVIRIAWKAGRMKAKYFEPATNLSPLSTGLSISQVDIKSMKLQKKKSKLSTLKKYDPGSIQISKNPLKKPWCC